MKLKSLSTSAIFLLLLVSLLAGCGAPAANSTPIPVIATRTPFLPTATLTPPPPATLTPFPPTDTPAPAAAAAGVAASSQERISAPDVPKSNRRTLTAGNNTFAFDLYQAIRDGEDNLLYSPYSLSVALAMIYAGARGQTEQQMADTLRFELPQELLHPAFNALDLKLDSRSHVIVRDASSDEVEPVTFQLSIANAVWGQTGHPFLPAYLDLLALNYGAGIRLVDFRTNVPAAIDAINRWISEETEGRIRDVVDDDLPSGARLVLANAVYFNAQWDQPFDQDRTRDEPFHLLGGGQENVPLMHQLDEFGYTEGDGYQAIQLPYLNRQVAMVVLLPAEGWFRKIEERLTGDWVKDVVKGFGKHEVILTMPKFRIETPRLSLQETLKTMGMPDAFSPAADFSGISEPQSYSSLFISEVWHKAFIDINEQRTEAAAATVVKKAPPGMTREELTKPPPIVMKIDRPFVFLIRDIETDTILFVGRVMNPASE